MVGQAQADVVNLLGQLARGGDDERLRRAARQTEELMQNWQEERRRLAGAGLGRGDEVPAGEDSGNRLRLNGSRLRVAHLRSRSHEQRMQTQGLERHDRLPGRLLRYEKRNYSILGKILRPL